MEPLRERVGDIVCEVSDDSGNYQTRLPQKKLNAFTAAIMQAVEEGRATAGEWMAEAQKWKLECAKAEARVKELERWESDSKWQGEITKALLPYQERAVKAEARASLFAKELEDAKADAESWEDQCDDARKLALQQAARAEKAEAREAVLRAALEKCRELFSEIRGDWSDPRSECREGWRIIDAALAVKEETP